MILVACTYIFSSERARHRQQSLSSLQEQYQHDRDCPPKYTTVMASPEKYPKINPKHFQNIGEAGRFDCDSCEINITENPLSQSSNLTECIDQNSNSTNIRTDMYNRRGETNCDIHTEFWDTSSCTESLPDYDQAIKALSQHHENVSRTESPNNTDISSSL